MLIRPESPQDYPAVMRIHTRAFGRLAEGLVVALLRQQAAYDPALSLVAEVDGEVAGHALFTPGPIRLLGVDVPAVLLAPIGIDPAYQRQGIGAALIHEGHRIARAQGFALSYLLGHPTYYPRLGYRPGVFGAASVQVDLDALRRKTTLPALEGRPPQEADIPALQALWQRAEAEVDFTSAPGDLLLDWLSPNPLMQTAVYLHEGRIVGYTRIKAGEACAPRVFVAADAAAAQAIAAEIGKSCDALTLPLHPYSASASAFEGVQCQAWDAGMGFSLMEDGPFDAFYAQQQAGQRPPGRPIWGTAFDVA